MVYVDAGSLTYLFNDGLGSHTTIDGGPLAAGTHAIELSVGAPGGRRWIVTLSVDGAQVGETVDVPMLFPMAPFQGIDVGIDRRSPVSWDIYEREGPFPFTGALRSVRYEPGEPAPDSGDRFIDFLKELGSKYE
jgi:arylsulfatase